MSNVADKWPMLRIAAGVTLVFCCSAPVVWLASSVFFSGRLCGTTAIRVSAGSFGSLTTLSRSPWGDNEECSNPIARICPPEPYVCSVYSAFDHRGAHPAWSLLASFTLPAVTSSEGQVFTLSPRIERIAPARHLCPWRRSDTRWPQAALVCAMPKSASRIKFGRPSCAARSVRHG